MQVETLSTNINAAGDGCENRFSLQIPKRVEKHFDFVEFNDDGILLLGTSNLTGKIWCGSVWLFNDPAHAPYVEKCLGGIEFENTIASGLWLDNGLKIIIGGDTGAMQLLNLTMLKDKPQCYFTTVGFVCEHDDSVLSLDSFDKKSKVISGSSDMSIKIWNTDTMLCERTYSPAHSHAVTSVSCQCNSKDVFVSTSLDNTCLIWDKRLERPASLLARTESGYMASSWLDENSLAIGSSSGNISIIDIRMKTELDRNFCTKRPIHKMKYNKELGVLAVAADDPTVRIFSCKHNILTRIYECDRHKDFVRGISFEPSTNKLYSCGWDSKILTHQVPQLPVNNNNMDVIEKGTIQS